MNKKKAYLYKKKVLYINKKPKYRTFKEQKTIDKKK